ncbi:hypothetical protein LL999_15060 [Burkholderia ambifaria]|uniref:T6SS effector BTH_I2691 family protein n=1 Tax=Burkholderia ambifaria TaxID=152480 RepID=UPI001E657E5F|nr:T6SS effector BTH_I2691 family protein [Burkholderia ambifaria]UEP21231.1 hypothetical protein LL999_15060 [Burkholderia ambifaria]
MTRKGCPMCDRESLLIYPVRYAIACPLGAAKAPALSDHFKIDASVPQSVGSAKYTLRALRQGYLYTYDEKRTQLFAYIVLDGGILYKFAPDITPPPAQTIERLAENSCPSGKDWAGSYGRCVSIQHTPGSDEAGNFWIGWSNVLWTKDLVHNKINEEKWRKQHMQCINVPAMVAGNATDTGEFQASQKNIAHFAMDAQAMKDAFGFSNRAPKDEIALRRKNAAKIIQNAMAESPLKKGFVIAVNDPVAITNDLAELTVPNTNNGLDNETYWKLISAQLLERAEASVRLNAREETRASYASSEMVAQINSDPMAMAPGAGGGTADLSGMYRVVKGWFNTGSLSKAIEEDSRQAQDIPGAQRKAAEEAWEEASTKKGADNKLVSMVDMQARDKFLTEEYPRRLDAFKPLWQPLVHAHVGWLKSKLLADWMAGNHDPKDIRSGYAYSESCAQAIGTAAGTEECQKVLNDWLNGRASDTGNLYARALMFNHEQLIKAADAQVRGSDIQYENILNIYKNAFDELQKKHQAANLIDRLVFTTANTLVKILAQGLKGPAIGFVTIRLALHAGAPIRAAHITPAQMRNWIVKQGEALGLPVDSGQLSQQAAAANIRKQVMKAAPPSDPAVFAYELDTAAWVKAGTLEASDVKVIKVPGVETTRKWLGSSSPTKFNQGVATAIFQLATLTFAYKDYAGSDQFNKGENLLKLTGSLVSILGNIVESVSETVKAAPAHPLSAYLMKQWAGAEGWAESGARAGRMIGAVAGIVLAGYDLLKNLPESYANKEYGLTALYMLSGTLGVYISLSPFFSLLPAAFAAWLPPLWIVLVAAIVVGIVIAHFKAAAIKDWISRCKFSKGEHYRSLDDELKAFNSAIGG